MRELKFRAWNPEEKLMGSGFSIYDDGELPTDYIIMQYTGFKDASQKEIYEGDIVQLIDSLYVVQDIRHFHIIQADLMIGKVIGNIHKNPELLKDK